MLIGGGVVGAGVVAYLLLRSRSANASTLSLAGGVPTAVQMGPDDTLAALRAAVGARAVANNGASGATSLINGVLSKVNAKNAQGMAQIGEKVIPGSGALFQAVGLKTGQTVTYGLEKAGAVAAKAISKLKFW